jgi:hypothetical protein
VAIQIYAINERIRHTNRISENAENEKGILEPSNQFYKMFSLGSKLKPGHAFKQR